MSQYSRLIAVLLLLVFVGAWRFNNEMRSEGLQTFVSQQVQFFDQILDHYTYLPPKFWKQRYFVNSAYFNSANGAVILYICGQGICNGVSDQSWTSEIAKSTNALILSLQHRYYGESLPFRANSFEIDNMKYLNSKQALKDLAYFIEEIKRNRFHGVTDSNKWITIGGSYPGALSAWFRAKYPHLTVGALASSAVILAVEDFRDFDQQIFLSANKSGEFCVDAIRKVTQYAQNQVLNETQRLLFQSNYSAQKLTRQEFMFYWSDVLVFQIQYGNRSAFCNSLKNKTLQQMLDTIITPLMLRVTPVDYGSYYLSSPDFALQDGRGARSWYYQSCSEFSYFQTFSLKHPMRSKLLNLSFYKKWCEDSYGPGTWAAVNRTNTQYGGLHLRTANLIITNGDQDPWKWASLRTNYKDIVAKVALCTDCAHCKDLRAPAKTDPKQITAIRDYQLAQIKSWLK